MSPAVHDARSTEFVAPLWQNFIDRKADLQQHLTGRNFIYKNSVL
jgi:hypothetical protein